MGITKITTPKQLDTKGVQKFLIKKWKQWWWIDKKDIEILKTIKEDVNIYNSLKEDEKKLFDILREEAEGNFDWKTIHNLKMKEIEKSQEIALARIKAMAEHQTVNWKSLREFKDDIDEKVFTITDTNDEIKKLEAKKDERLKKLNDFLNKHPKFNDHSLRNFWIGAWLFLILAGWVITKAKLDDIAFGKEQERLKALREQEKTQDWTSLTNNAVKHINEAESQYDIDDAVGRYSDIIEKKRDTLWMHTDSIFSWDVLTSTWKFEKTNPEQAKKFLTKFLTGDLSDSRYEIDVWQIERWLNAPESSYADDFRFSRIKDSATRNFLETILQQLKSYESNTKEIGNTYTEFMKKINEAKHTRYQKLWIKEEKKNTQTVKKTPEEKKNETQKNKIYTPIHQMDETMLIIDMMINKTNIADWENDKSAEHLLEKKIQERDHKKQQIDDQKNHNENEVKDQNAQLVRKETGKEYKEHENEKRYYEYAKALFIKQVLAHIEYRSGYDYKNKVIRYETALADSLAKSPMMHEIQAEIWSMQKSGNQMTKNSVSLIEENAKDDKANIDYQYSGFQKELDNARKHIAHYENTLKEHVNTFASIINKDNASAITSLQQWRNTLEKVYNMTPENIEKLMKYKLDGLFFSYNFEDINVLKKFETQVKHISIITGLSKEDIYSIAVPYIHDDMNEVNKDDLELWKTEVKKLGIQL